MRRETQNVLLVLVGGALLKIALNGSYLRYVRPSIQPWLIASGVVMVVLAAVAIVRDIRSYHATEQPAADHDGHRHGSRSSWLLVVPVLAIFLIAPPALGADAVARAGGRTIISQAAPAVTQQGAAAFPPLPAEPVVPLSMSEFVTRSVWDATGSLNSRVVRLTGFVAHEGGSTYLARLVITCCAADATPVKVTLVGAGADAQRDDQWLAVDGRIRPGSATQHNDYTPTFDVVTVAPIATPADPYEY
ncbi:MAG TPA: TIGR03943 family protein [Pseudonocardiaceae bacterium]|nr:TIGR03943 family protein [Pseudonocardiaceae bacterium]